MGFVHIFQGVEITASRTYLLHRALDNEALISIYRLKRKDMKMRDFDFAPLYRSAIGFDRFAQLADKAMRNDSQPSYPPYNIERLADNEYRITMAVAGFDRSELDVEIENETLKIVGRKGDDETRRNYLHRGIGARDFEHRFQLAEHLRVVSAGLDKGLLSIDLLREVPEALKPRKIEIGQLGKGQEMLESIAA